MASKTTKIDLLKTFIRSPAFIVSVIVLILGIYTTHMASATMNRMVAEQISPEQYGMGLIAAAIAVAGSCLAAGIAIYGAASAGAAAMAERPETSVWVLILAGLAEGVAIYGLLVAIMILGKLP